MASVVVSYAAQDASRARVVVRKLSALGYGVVETTLAEAAPATLPRIVLWSRASEHAPSRRLASDKTVIARLDVAAPPMIRGATRVNLQAWQGRQDHRGWQALLAALPATSPARSGPAPKRPSAVRPSAPASRQNEERLPAPSPEAPPPAPAKKSGAGWLWITVGLVCLLAAAGGAYFMLA